jgi:hypothetical protein
MSQLYAGTLPVLAILIFGIGRGLAWTREVRFFSLAALALILYALGSYTPLFRVVFELLPGVNAFRRPADATFLIGGMTAILGGYLVHRAASGTGLGRRDLAVGLASLILLFSAAITVAISAGHFHDALAPLAKAAGWTVAAAIALLVVTRLPARASGLAMLAVAPLLAADLAVNNGPNESTALPPQRFDILDPATKNETILLLKRLLAQPLPSDRRDRVELLGVGFEWPNAPMIHGFDHTLGYNPLRIAEVSDATGARDYIAGPDQRVFSPLFPSYRSLLADMLGLRYIVSSVPIGRVDPASSSATCGFSPARPRAMSTRTRARCPACCSPPTGWRWISTG